MKIKVWLMFKRRIIKKIFFLILVLASKECFSQTPPGYTKINMKLDWIGVKFDSGCHIPTYGGIPYTRFGIWDWAGNIGVDTINHRFYYRSGGAWRYVVGGSTGTTLQQVFDAETGGSVLAKNDTIKLNSKILYINSGMTSASTNSFRFYANDTVYSELNAGRLRLSSTSFPDVHWYGPGRLTATMHEKMGMGYDNGSGGSCATCGHNYIDVRDSADLWIESDGTNTAQFRWNGFTVIGAKGNVLIHDVATTATDNGKKLQVMGDAFVRDSLLALGKVKFSGLTGGSSTDSILTKDANHIVHYRDVTTLIPNLVTGIYQPTLTSVTNVTANTSYSSTKYFRQGDMVTVFGKLQVDPTAVGAIELGISLPIASNFTNDDDCAGLGASTNITGEVLSILADATNDRAALKFNATDLTNRTVFFHFSYQIK